MIFRVNLIREYPLYSDLSVFWFECRDAGIQNAGMDDAGKNQITLMHIKMQFG